jgi:hypothetical protein
MSERRTPTQRTLSLSVILGTLLVPLSAVAALVLTDTAEPSGEAAASTTTSITVPTTQTQTSVAANGLDDDLAEACGPAGMELVGLEMEGSLTDIQQAALDALREVCEQEAMPLPAGPTPEPIVETVFVSDGPAATTTSTLPGYEDDDQYDDEYEYEDDDHDQDDEDDEDDDHDQDDEDDEDDDHDEDQDEEDGHDEDEDR